MQAFVEKARLQEKRCDPCHQVIMPHINKRKYRASPPGGGKDYDTRRQL
jgi:hypothetical protein